jgi:hypothetical protein
MLASLLDEIYLFIDTLIYYIINGVMLMMSFADTVNEFTNKMQYNYKIVSTSFKHKMYNNIN